MYMYYRSSCRSSLLYQYFSQPWLRWYRIVSVLIGSLVTSSIKLYIILFRMFFIALDAVLSAEWHLKSLLYWIAQNGAENIDAVRLMPVRSTHTSVILNLHFENCCTNTTIKNGNCYQVPSSFSPGCRGSQRHSFRRSYGLCFLTFFDVSYRR